MPRSNVRSLSTERYLHVAPLGKGSAAANSDIPMPPHDALETETATISPSSKPVGRHRTMLMVGQKVGQNSDAPQKHQA